MTESWQCSPSFQEGKEGRPWYLQACPSHFSAVIAHSQHGFREGKVTESQNHRMVGVGRDLCGSSSPTLLLKSSLRNLISFYGKVTHLIDQGKLLDVFLFHFSKAFDIVFRSILLEKTSSIQLEKSMMCWVSNCLMGQAQSVTVNGVTSGWWSVTRGLPKGVSFRASIL